MGAEGKIYEGMLDQNKPKKVALKKQKDAFTEDQILLLNMLKGQNSDHIIEIIVFGKTSEGKNYIVMELGEQINFLNLANKQQTCLEMAKSVQILHNYGYIHRDLKPENFVISRNGKIKLIDFGITRKMDDNICMSLFKGTYEYIAPEVIISQEYDASVDIWSLGAIFFEVLVGKQFFSLLNIDNRFKDYLYICQLQINNIIKKQSNLQKQDKEILQKMIVQRLNIQKDLSLNKSIERININDLVDQLENLYKLDKSISSKIEENNLLNQQAFSINTSSQSSINSQNSIIQNKSNFQIEQFIPQSPTIISDQVNDIAKTTSFSVLVNLEEISEYQWCGQYGKNQNKKGKWTVVWKGEQLQNVGGKYDGIKFKNIIKYLEEGKKIGKWKELFHNFRNQAQVYEVGEYMNSQKSGTWKYIYNDQEIGEGIYNEQGQRNGKQIELSEGFWNQCQVIYIGVYENGNKVGKWDIMYRQRNKFQLIGGGVYEINGRGGSFKIGNWIELSNCFSDLSQVTYKGSYNKGSKQGKWEIFWNYTGNNEKIGGGSYEAMLPDNDLSSLKIGKWIELIEDYQKDRQVTYVGRYKDGKKVAKWETIYKQFGKNQQNEAIGGGSYSENPDNWVDSIKIGRWIELNVNFKMDSQVIHVGSYKNNNKVGKWDIFYRKNDQDKFDWIGGGSFDYKVESNGTNKIGKWTDISEFFSELCQVTYTGQFQRGQKFGQWDIMLRQNDKLEWIGGGVYDNDYIKQGDWVELNEGFYWNNQTIFSGIYENGIKIGKWDIWQFKNSRNIQKEKIGGGSYKKKEGEDQIFSPIKEGRWIELSKRFNNSSQITYDGEYQNGIKIGKWSTFWNLNGINQDIGGGKYQVRQVSDNIIYSYKVKQWIELSNQFHVSNQVYYQGEYQNGNKVGKWDIFYKDVGVKKEWIGGGYYEITKGDDSVFFQIKNGRWIELSDRFDSFNQVIFKGDYKCGKKVGRWYKMKRQVKKVLGDFSTIGQEYY